MSKYENELQLPRYVLVVLVDNERGILSRIAGMFSARGYNIESLTVSAVAHDQSMSRMNIVTHAHIALVRQIEAQLHRLVPVREVYVLETSYNTIEREVLLLKCVNSGTNRQEALRIANAFNVRIIDMTLTSFVSELVGDSSTLSSFIEVMRQLGDVEVARSGSVAMTRGSTIADPDLSVGGSVHVIAENRHLLFDASSDRASPVFNTLPSSSPRKTPSATGRKGSDRAAGSGKNIQGKKAKGGVSPASSNKPLSPRTTITKR